MKAHSHIYPLQYRTDCSYYFDKLSSLSYRMWLDAGMQIESSKIEVQDTRRFDILTADPIELMSTNMLVDVETRIKNLLSEHCDDAPIDCPFPGGAIGYINYEGRHAKFGLKQPAYNRENWAIFDWAIIQDKKRRECYAIFHSNCDEAKIAERMSLLTDLNQDAPPALPKNYTNANFEVTKFKPDISKTEYRDAFEKIQSYILSGDCYQINYTQRFTAKFDGVEDSAYKHLRRVLSGSYSAYLDFDGQKVLSFSPEQFIEAKQKSARTKPIKGTIKRSKDKNEDDLLAEQLKNSDKDHAENVMIVDLLRNDFSKSCKPHSVSVTKLFNLESYQNVHHLVSTVEGTVADNKTQSDLFDDCFPGGSITGAPKKRAMEIIDELEPHSRQVYCGAIVCLGANQQLRSSIPIRTLLIEDKNIYCWGGGGIVADSEFETEYAESIQKVQILMHALETKRGYY